MKWKRERDNIRGENEKKARVIGIYVMHDLTSKRRMRKKVIQTMKYLPIDSTYYKWE